jgi:hypothetical protein
MKFRVFYEEKCYFITLSSIPSVVFLFPNLDSDPQNTPIIQRWTNYVSIVKQFILDCGLIGLVVLSFVLIFIEVIRSEIILDSIEVTADIKKLGYQSGNSIT